MTTHDRARISSVTVILSDDDDLDPVVIAGESTTNGGFFADFGLGRIQFSGTPGQLERLGQAMIDGAADLAERLAANERAVTV